MNLSQGLNIDQLETLLKLFENTSIKTLIINNKKVKFFMGYFDCFVKYF